MAIYHLHVKAISRNMGRSSVAAAAYRAGEKLRDDNTIAAAAYRSGEELRGKGVTHDYRHKTGVAHTEIMLPNNAPPEYFDRNTLWNAVEKSETRVNSRTAREVEVSLPIEFNIAEQIEVLRAYGNNEVAA